MSLFSSMLAAVAALYLKTDQCTIFKMIKLAFFIYEHLKNDLRFKLLRKNGILIGMYYFPCEMKFILQSCMNNVIVCC